MKIRKAILILAFFLLAFTIGNGAAVAVSECFNISSEGNKLDSLDWGLSFQAEGETPVGNSSSDELKKSNAFYVGDNSKKQIYLTFDAGYENGNMDKILEVLKKHNICATFFVVGNFMETNPKLIKKMVENGHIIGNHSYHHPDMTGLTKEEFTKELTDLEEKYKSITGKEMEKVYRPPQGKYSENSLTLAKQLGYKTFFWSLAYVDWYDDNQPTKDEAFDKLLGRIHPGAIVLLHSTSKTNGEILDELLTKWEELGYSFGKLTDIK